MPFLPPNQQCQSTEGNIKQKNYLTQEPQKYFDAAMPQTANRSASL